MLIKQKYMGFLFLAIHNMILWCYSRYNRTESVSKSFYRTSFMSTLEVILLKESSNQIDFYCKCITVNRIIVCSNQVESDQEYAFNAYRIIESPTSS